MTGCLYPVDSHKPFHLLTTLASIQYIVRLSKV